VIPPRENREPRVDAFYVKFIKQLSVKRRRARLAQDKAAFRRWLDARKTEGTITNESWEECRLIRLMEAVESTALMLIWDGPFPSGPPGVGGES
jgi:hypothetical protein